MKLWNAMFPLNYKSLLKNFRRLEREYNTYFNVSISIPRINVAPHENIDYSRN